MMDFKTGWKLFKRHADMIGYRKKVSGDYAFLNSRGRMIKLKGIKADYLDIYRDDCGGYQLTPEGKIQWKY